MAKFQVFISANLHKATRFYFYSDFLCVVSHLPSRALEKTVNFWFVWLLLLANQAVAHIQYKKRLNCDCGLTAACRGGDRCVYSVCELWKASQWGPKATQQTDFQPCMPCQECKPTSQLCGGKGQKICKSCFHHCRLKAEPINTQKRRQAD